MTCPVCHEDIASGSVTCPKCGAQLVPTLTKEQRKGGWRVTVALFVISVVLMGVFVAAILAWHDEQQRTMQLEQEAAESYEVVAEAGNDEPVLAPRVEAIPSEE